MMNLLPSLTSQRLRLRALDLQDEQEIFSLRSNEQVNLHLDREPAKTLTDARKFIMSINAMIEKGEGLYWAICLKENPRLIGTICYFDLSKAHSSAEMGYELLPFYQGKGLMHEALLLVIQFGFHVMDLKSIVACPTKENVRSIQLLKRNGFKEVASDAENMLKFVLER